MKIPAVIIGKMTSPPPRIARLTFIFDFLKCFSSSFSLFLYFCFNCFIFFLCFLFVYGMKNPVKNFRFSI